MTGRLTRAATGPAAGFEAKSLCSDGKPCGKQTRGLLSGLITDLDDALTEYHDPAQHPFRRLVAPVLHTVPIEQAAPGARVSQRTVERARVGHRIGATARSKLTAYAIRHARAQLRATGTRPPTDHEALLATYLERQTAPDPEPRLCACGCRRPVEGRKRYLDPAHKQAAYRQRKAA